MIIWYNNTKKLKYYNNCFVPVILSDFDVDGISDCFFSSHAQYKDIHSGAVTG